MQAPENFIFRFEKARKNQAIMMREIYGALSMHKSIFINAPTGIGKTDAAISSCLSYALEHGLSILFLTPKNSQHKIAVEVLSGLRKKFNLDFRYVDIVGKRNMCVNPDVNLMEGEAFYKTCEHKMKNRGCQFYERSKDVETADQSLAESGMQGHNALFRESFERGYCAYEISAKIARDANFIIADYAHMLNPSVMKAFMRKIGHALRDSIVIWDEAHNITSIASSYLSMSLTTSTIKRASAELTAIGSGIDLGYLEYMLNSMADSKIKKKGIGEAFVGHGDIPETIKAGKEEICGQLENAAMQYINNAQARRSSLMHVSRFIRLLSSYGDSDAVIISRYGKGVKLSVSCLYPSEAIAPMKEAYANVFMSGTLLPIGMHKEMLGFPDAITATYPAPFPKENRICLLDKDVSTKYSQRTLDHYKLIAQRISAVRNSVRGNVAVFFPGFEVMNAVRRYLKNPVRFVQRVEMRSYQVEQMISEFKGGEDNLLFAVMGGSMSEGIDYANNVIKGIIIVGIPLEHPNLELRARIEYLNKKFGMKGNEYAYLIPGVVKAAQAAGRAIRSEKDRAFILFMDRRYSWSIYKSIISDFMQIEEGDDYLPRIVRFMDDSAILHAGEAGTRKESA